jgi:hypothetical protein
MIPPSQYFACTPQFWPRHTHGTLRLPCLALKLAFYVSGSLSQSLFHLATKIFGITGKAILVHERIPSEIQNFNGREGKSFPSSRKTPNG